MVARKSFAKRIHESLDATKSGGRWEQLITTLLRRLELDPVARKDAEAEYRKLAVRIADNLDLPYVDVDVFPQGSMRTQTTIRPAGNTNFDLDIVVALSGPGYDDPDPELLFKEFGEALEGDEAVTGVPEPKRRCWRLRYPGKRYYFDVTPAVPDPSQKYGARLRVRDPETVWTPSNPVEFAEWFCERADLKFPFQSRSALGMLTDARKSIEPLPNEPVRIDDILRRTVQLMKLHRDLRYFTADERAKEGCPISVIIVTLAGLAYENIWRKRGNEFNSPIDVVLAIIEEMPNYIGRNAAGRYFVCNPTLATENFAERWNNDNGLRASEFMRWHAALEDDLEALLTDDYSKANENKIKAIFGQAGVDAWKASIEETRPNAPLLQGLITSSGVATANPKAPTPLSRNTRTLA